MHIFCLGLNHFTAPVELREQLSLDEAGICAALTRPACGCASIAELVIISTCNRIELYAASRQAPFAELEAFLSLVSGTPADQIRPHLYHLKGPDAARHLFEVAAGLDSLVVGEPQILGQVVRALELSREQAMAGPLLNRLFQTAVHAGKRTRAETNISRNPASISSLAASLSMQAVQDLSQAQIAILGAGEMAELALEALRKRGAKRILVVNRTLERAQTLAQRWNAQAATFENISAALTSADILISSTASPHRLISHEMVEEAMIQRAGRELVLIDIAVPRNIDPQTVNIPRVRLYDMDSLNAQLECSLANRMAEVPQVKAILEEELSRFGEYLKSLEMIPIIADMRQQAEVIRQEVMQKTLRRMPDLTEAERARIEAMTQALVKKLLHAPTRRLHAEAACPHAPDYAAVARSLFNLSDGHDSCSFSNRACPISIAAD
jgi:glutamyl-tRNA reductase